MGRRIGVLGAGWGTRVSVPAFRAAGWEVVGLWSRRPERAQAEAARLDIPLATIDAEALIARPDVDAVAIHTPPVDSPGALPGRLRGRQARSL